MNLGLLFILGEVEGWQESSNPRAKSSPVVYFNYHENQVMLMKYIPLLVGLILIGILPTVGLLRNWF